MRRLNKGFSLVELMIVVAIIGILAAIAIPSYINYQLSAKRSEVKGAVDGIKTAEMKYDAENDGYIALSVQPRADADLDKQFEPWGTYTDWTSVGWRPDGEIRGNYRVTGTGGADENFLVTGKSDVDNDNNFHEITASRAVNTVVTSGSENYY